MSKLDKLFQGLVTISVATLVAVYFLLDRKYDFPEELEEPETYVIGVAATEHPLGEMKFSTDTQYETAERKFTYDEPAFVPAFGARTKEIRLMLANIYGGSENTEAAVEMALAYLARVQNADGSWSETKKPKGSTGLALQCFLGAGYSDREYEYQEVVAKGLAYLLKNQAKSGAISGENLYTSGIAGTVFSEAYGLTGDSKYSEAAQKVIDYMVKGQGPEGGWGYNPYKAGGTAAYRYDTSVTGWVVMAFKSAKMVGLHVPAKAIARYKKYAIFATRSDDGMAFYSTNKDGKKIGYRETMTASTLMCRLYMGEGLKARLIRPGMNRLMVSLPKNLKPVWREQEGAMDNYLWYHAAQVAFLAGKGPWHKWNTMLKDLLVRNQIKDGPRRGAWEDSYFKWGNRSDVYATCLNVMTLQTYYRYYR